MTEPLIYHIETVEDFLKVPSDRLSDCLADFANFLELARTTKELLKEVGVQMALEEENPVYTQVEWSTYRFSWIDDGLKNAKIILQTGKEDGQ